MEICVVLAQSPSPKLALTCHYSWRHGPLSVHVSLTAFHRCKPARCKPALMLHKIDHLTLADGNQEMYHASSHGLSLLAAASSVTSLCQFCIYKVGITLPTAQPGRNFSSGNLKTGTEDQRLCHLLYQQELQCTKYPILPECFDHNGLEMVQSEPFGSRPNQWNDAFSCPGKILFFPHMLMVAWIHLWPWGYTKRSLLHASVYSGWSVPHGLELLTHIKTQKILSCVNSQSQMALHRSPLQLCWHKLTYVVLEPCITTELR